MGRRDRRKITIIEIREEDITYMKGEYIAFRDSYGKFVVYNTLKPFKHGHTHLNSKKRVVELIDNAIDKHFPLHWSNRFIESMIRISCDKRFIERLIHLRITRKGKERNYRRDS